MLVVLLSGFIFAVAFIAEIFVLVSDLKRSKLIMYVLVFIMAAAMFFLAVFGYSIGSQVYDDSYEELMMEHSEIIDMAATVDASSEGEINRISDMAKEYNKKITYLQERNKQKIYGLVISDDIEKLERIDLNELLQH